ncbi:MAG: hypothetical protein Q8S75_09850, partial [Nitrospirota bacterium]|nr:hypothetical protein [Nitrospirota bacterium]
PPFSIPGLHALGTLNASDAISTNTDTLQLTGGTSYTGVLDPVSGASNFAFDDITGTSLSIFATRTLGLLSRGNIAFTGTIDLLGSGGLDMVGSDSMTLANVNALGDGQTVSLTANQINLGGTVNSGSRALSVSAVEPINLSGDIGSGVISLSGREGLVLSTGAGATKGTVVLGSGLVTLTGGSTSGQIVISSTTGQIVGSPGVTVVAPVPVPAASLLFATGIAVLGVVKRQRS